jgi:hypothetical protein
MHPDDLVSLKPQTPAEIEACVIILWCLLARGNSGKSMSDFRRSLIAIEDFVKSIVDQCPEGDMHILWAISKTRTGQHTEALNILNQCIAACPTFVPALTEKALLLAGMGEWEQTLDTAQRILDAPQEHGGGQVSYMSRTDVMY